MKSFTLKERCLIGLTLFSMFFGAGNLIFPPFLGALAGDATLPAMSGFAVTAVLFPILGVAAVARSGGLTALGNRVHPTFAFLFTLLIYLSIGPCLAIPRTAGTSFEMAIAPLFAGEGALSGTIMGFEAHAVAQAAYSVFFFLLAFTIALNPEKLTQRLGKILSPTLLTLIAVLFIAAIVHPLGEYGAVRAPYDAAPFVRGFIEGYQTMDTLAALNFGLIIAMNIRALGVTKDSGVVRETIFAGFVAGFLLITVYAALAHIGAEAGGAGLTGENGAQTLTGVVIQQFGHAGLFILGAIFFIACLNTCVGLLSCCSNYFRDTFPVLGYRGWLTVFAVTSTIIANAGLTAILKFSVPVLVAIYPLALVLIILAFLHPFIEKHRFAYPMTMLFTGAAAITAGFGQAGFKLPVLADFFAAMPFAAEGLDWMLPAAVGLVVGIALSLVTPKKAA